MNEQNYASLEASKRLVEAGIVLETEAVWRKKRDKTGYYLSRKSLYHRTSDAPAPSMAEVWRELPEGFKYDEAHAYLCMVKSRKEDGTTYGFYCLPNDEAICGSKKHDANPTDALIDLKIWTVEQARKERP